MVNTETVILKTVQINGQWYTKFIPNWITGRRPVVTYKQGILI